MPTIIVACRVCRAPLTLYTNAAKHSVWLHPAEMRSDHAPEPENVDSLDALSFCDVCSAPGPAWRVGAHSFTVVTTRAADWRSEGDWALCDACDRDVSASRVNALVARAIGKQRHRLRPDDLKSLREDLRTLYKRLLDQRTGERERVW